jgi:hypothetical protein
MRKDAKVVDVGGGALFKAPTCMQGSYSVADRQQKRRQITMSAVDKMNFLFLNFLAICSNKCCFLGFPKGEARPFAKVGCT